MNLCILNEALKQELPVLSFEPDGQGAVSLGRRDLPGFEEGHGTVGRKNRVGRVVLDPLGVAVDGCFEIAFLWKWGKQGYIRLLLRSSYATEGSIEKL